MVNLFEEPTQDRVDIERVQKSLLSSTTAEDKYDEELFKIAEALF